jgi:membrane-associated phospholipid phosphatase
LLALAAATYILAFRWSWLARADLDAVFDPRTGDLRAIASALTRLSPGWIGAGISLTLAACGLVAQARAADGRRGAARAIAIVAGCFLTGELVKWVLGTLHPLEAASPHPASQSFPSVHAAIAMVVAVGVMRLAAGRGVRLVIAYPAVMGILTVLVGWHYPTDVAGGWLLGAAWALAIPRARVRAGAAVTAAIVAAEAVACMLLAGYAVAFADGGIAAAAFGFSAAVLAAGAMALTAYSAGEITNSRLSSGVRALTRR